MVIRLFLVVAFAALLAGFIWFSASVIWLGLKEFFKMNSAKSASSKGKMKKSP